MINPLLIVRIRNSPYSMLNFPRPFDAGDGNYNGRVGDPVIPLDFKTFFRQAAWCGDFLRVSPYSPDISMTYVSESSLFRLSSFKQA